MSTSHTQPNAWALVPMKRMELGKSRLSPVLSQADRIVLQMAMLCDVISALSRVAALTGVAVVSCDRDAERIARARSVEFLHEPPQLHDINDAVAFGSDALRAMGADLIAVLPADIPLIDPEEIAHALHVADRDGVMVVVPDRAHSGTNGLVFASASPPRFAYGADSIFRHLEQQGGLPRPVALALPSLELDVDEPQDLDLLRERLAASIGSATRAVLDGFPRMTAQDMAVSFP